MKRVLIFAIACIPLSLFAKEGVETDIIQRTVNFFIFAAIIWYLLADKIKVFFINRRLGIQAELDKVQEVLKQSQSKVNDAILKLEDAKKLAIEIVEGANLDVDAIKTKVIEAAKNEIVHLNKNFEEKTNLESKKAKRVVINELLEKLFNSDAVEVGQDELVDIVLKKVA